MHKVLLNIFFSGLLVVLSGCSLECVDAEYSIYAVYGQVEQVNDSDISFKLGDLKQDNKRDFFSDDIQKATVLSNGESVVIDIREVELYFEDTLKVGDVVFIIFKDDDSVMAMSPVDNQEKVLTRRPTNELPPNINK